MGKPTGFMEFSRLKPQARPVDERVQDFRHVYIDPDPAALKKQAGRCMDCGVPFCNRGCPLGNVIPDWNDLVWRDRFEEALDRLHATNNFPEVTGLVCPAPCEAACVLSLQHAPVTIKSIEYAIIQRAFDEGRVHPRPAPRPTGRRVAIIGSGPAGLACAQQLARAGHAVEVFEREDRPGGLLRYGIPDFKLEKGVLDRRLAQLQAEGVRFHLQVEVGRDVSPDDLRARFDAVVLACGAEAPRDLPIPGRDLQGVRFAMDYLTRQNRRCAGDDLPDDPTLDAAGKRVVVLGGGDTGSDCIGTAHRQGAAHVLNLELMTRPPDDLDPQEVWPRWPHVFRASSSHEEGGERAFSALTTRFEGRDGHVTALHIAQVQPGPDGRPTPIPGTEQRVEADLVLLAMGYLHPRQPLLEAFGVARDPRGNVQADASRWQTNLPGVFAAGDARRGQSLVVWAIAEGRQCAAAVDAWLTPSAAP